MEIDVIIYVRQAVNGSNARIVGVIMYTPRRGREALRVHTTLLKLSKYKVDCCFSPSSKLSEVFGCHCPLDILFVFLMLYTVLRHDF